MKIHMVCTDMQEKSKAKLRDIARPRPDRNAVRAGFTRFRVGCLRFKIHICINS